MPRYRIVTQEHMWVKCVHIVDADNMPNALRVISEDGDSVPREIERADGDFASDDITFLSAEQVDDNYGEQ
jgi:hypothetical protein